MGFLLQSLALNVHSLFQQQSRTNAVILNKSFDFIDASYKLLIQLQIPKISRVLKFTLNIF
jgi:hypothetical protein